jgi:hypothetical protein
MDWKWFNISSQSYMWRGSFLKLINLFNRENPDNSDDHWWGFGLLQVNQRHLFYIGHSGISIFWIGKTGCELPAESTGYYIQGNDVALLKYYMCRSVLVDNGRVYNPVAEEAKDGNPQAIRAMGLRSKLLKG